MSDKIDTWPALLPGQVRWLGEWTDGETVCFRFFVGRHKQGAVFSGEATASDDTAKKDAERRVAKMFGVEVPT